jgi:hypothetical protein
MKKPYFNATLAERDLILRIAQRAQELRKRYHGSARDLLDFQVDIEACHCNGTKLDLKKLFESRDNVFIHDVFGIDLHLNRVTGKLVDGFLPKCAR